MSNITQPKHMQNKIAIFGDIQIHNYKMHGTGTSRLDNCIACLEDIYARCDAMGITTILFVGDMHDTFGVITVQTLLSTMASFKRLAGLYPNIRMYAISGNHDMATKNLIDSPCVSVLSYIAMTIPSNFSIVDRTYYHVAGEKDSSTVAVIGIPYFEYKEHYQNCLQQAVELAKKLKDGFSHTVILLTHQTPKGTDNDMIPADTNPADPEYKAFDFVFNGHIHKHQQITTNYWNVGSPLHRDAGDIGQEKGFLVLDLDTKKVSRVILTGYPEFKRISATDTPDPNHFNVVELVEDVAQIASHDVERFDTSLSNESIMENYWQEVDGKDKELLEVGLSFLK